MSARSQWLAGHFPKHYGKKRFADIEETNFFALATILDPWFKDKLFSNAAFCQDAVILLNSQYRAEIEDCEPAYKWAATDDRPVVWVVFIKNSNE